MKHSLVFGLSVSMLVALGAAACGDDGDAEGTSSGGAAGSAGSGGTPSGGGSCGTAASGGT
ncbi:MAG: hypothetical protein HYZ29_12110, partial [Myxococcales bacterium]|nr:hypothetical protein [Myxococcales bacterium]